MICPFYCKAKYIYSALGLAAVSVLGTVFYYALTPDVTAVPTWAPSTPTFLPSRQPSISPTLNPTRTPTLSPTLFNLSLSSNTNSPSVASDDSLFYEQAPYIVAGIAAFVFTFAGVYGIYEYRRVCLSVSPDRTTSDPSVSAVPHIQLPSPHFHEASDEAFDKVADKASDEAFDKDSDKAADKDSDKDSDDDKWVAV